MPEGALGIQEMTRRSVSEKVPTCPRPGFAGKRAS